MSPWRIMCIAINCVDDSDFPKWHKIGFFLGYYYFTFPMINSFFKVFILFYFKYDRLLPLFYANFKLQYDVCLSPVKS